MGTSIVHVSTFNTSMVGATVLFVKHYVRHPPSQRLGVAAVANTLGWLAIRASRSLHISCEALPPRRLE